MTAPLTSPERISDEQLDMIIADASGGYLTMLALRELKVLREAAADLLSQIDGCDGTAQLSIERVEALVGTPSNVPIGGQQP